MDIPNLNSVSFGEVIWWVLIIVALAMLWRLVSAVQSLANVLKKFEDFKITELPSSAPVAQPQVTAAPAASAIPAAASSNDIPNEIVAVIAAAVDTVMNGPHRILSITPTAGDGFSQSSTAWSAEGRRQIFQSHRVR
jgi:hypothetical protein